MVLNQKQKEAFKQKLGRKISSNEIVIEDIPEKDILEIQSNLEKEGYKSEYWKAERQISGHLHIKDIPHLESLSKNQLKRYKELFIRKYVPVALLNKVDFQLCGVHRIAEENKEHYKGYGIKTLVKSVNSDKPNFCDKELFDLAKQEIIVPKETKDYQDIIEQIKKHWITGQRQTLALNLSGYLRKEKRLSILLKNSPVSKLLKAGCVIIPPKANQICNPQTKDKTSLRNDIVEMGEVVK
jgi:hypothetical protein